MLGNNKAYIYEDSLVSVNVNKRSFTHQTLFFYDLTKQAKLIIHSLTQLSLVFRISLSHSSTIFFFFSFNFGTQKQPIITEKTFLPITSLKFFQRCWQRCGGVNILTCSYRCFERAFRLHLQGLHSFFLDFTGSNY